MSDYGILYPTSLGKKNHTKLAIYCCDEDKKLTRFINKSISELREEVEFELNEELERSHCETLLISCEWLHPRIRSVEEFERLKALLLKFTSNIDIIMYIRPQTELYSSLYSTGLKGGSFKEFSFPKNIPYFLNYLEIYKQWMANLKINNFIVGDFNSSTLQNNDLLDDFLSKLDIDDTHKFIKDNEHKNKSLNINGITLLRALNFSLANKLFDNENTEINFRELKGLLETKFSGKHDFYSTEEKNVFQSSFDELNSELAEILSIDQNYKIVLSKIDGW
ncbi:hypothetical protein GCM10027170_39940 [Aliiglaciecola aliphaticivorans]